MPAARASPRMPVAKARRVERAAAAVEAGVVGKMQRWCCRNRHRNNFSSCNNRCSRCR
uniref:Uncharacterized protein n=1 Tax=Arundo donax TaxID=35708 RepID=A0A0A9F8K1_ARUDO